MRAASQPAHEGRVWGARTASHENPDMLREEEEKWREEEDGNRENSSKPSSSETLSICQGLLQVVFSTISSANH